MPKASNIPKSRRTPAPAPAPAPAPNAIPAAATALAPHTTGVQRITAAPQANINPQELKTKIERLVNDPTAPHKINLTDVEKNHIDGLEIGVQELNNTKTYSITKDYDSKSLIKYIPEPSVGYYLIVTKSDEGSAFELEYKNLNYLLCQDSDLQDFKNYLENKEKSSSVLVLYKLFTLQDMHPTLEEDTNF